MIMLKPVSAIAAVLFATALVAPTVSHAQDVPSATVSYADLNLSNAEGREALKNRIAGVAGQLCDVGASIHELALFEFTRTCRTSAIASAQPAYEAAVAAARRGSVTVLSGATLTVTAQ
jgi:UrcA family protein